MRGGYVYAMQCVATGRIKIGYSVDPEKRLLGLNSGSSTNIVMLAYWPGTRADETRIHRTYATQKVCLKNSREWFRPNDALVRLVRAHGGEPVAATHVAKDDPICVEQSAIENEAEELVKDLATMSGRLVPDETLAGLRKIRAALAPAVQKAIEKRSRRAADAFDQMCAEMGVTQ